MLDPANWITFWHPRLTKIVCVCNATKKALRDSGIPESKLATVWEGPSLDTLQPLPRSTRSEFDVPADAFVVGLVANMRRVKGVDLLLRAALRLADLPDIYWLLIGDVLDPQIESLAKDPRIANRIRLPGRRTNGGRYASLMDVYASPSRMEGMPMSIMEAMSLGACTVTTTVGGCTELVRHQLDGLTVPPNDPAALANAIRSLYCSPSSRRALIESARERAHSVFCVRAWAERLHSVYADVAGNHAARAA